MLTLNQEIEIFKNFSLKHKQLGKGISNYNFFFGNEWDIEASNKAQYPLMWVQLLPTKAEPRGAITRTFQIDFSDLVNQDKSNENHVLSDCEQLCIDLINYLDSINSENQDIIMNIGNVSEITDYQEKKDNDVSGWFFTVEIKSHQEGTSCNLPINSGNIFDENYIYVGGEIANGFTVEIKDQDGNVIQTFNTSGQYVVTVLSGIKDTITSNVTTITDDII
jgi:hypothetical protein